MVTNNYVFVGANSELASAFSEQLTSNNCEIYGISRKPIPYLNESNQIQIKDYINDAPNIINFIKDIERPNIIFFNGFLAENRNIYFPNFDEIVETINANYLAPIGLTFEIRKIIKANKFIYISSMAAIKPRNKNYIYGLSKKSLEETISKEKDLNYLIVRFGQIETRMSENHKRPPSTLTKKSAAIKLFNHIDKSGIIYASISLKLISIFMKFLPTKIIDAIEK